jgi:hypothetical protein
MTEIASLSRIQRLEATCPVFVEMARQAVRAERHTIEKTQLARARSVGAGTGHHDGADFGPPIRADHAQVEREFRADPDPQVGPLVHGGRVRDGLHAMRKRKHISIREWHAVCQLRDDIDFAGGARLDRYDNGGIRTPFSGNAWPDEHQLDAMRRVRALWVSLPPESLPLTFWMVMAGGTLTEYARLVRVRTSDITEQFAATLVLILDFYDGEAL